MPIPFLNMQIQDNNIHYGPTPFQPSTGENAYFGFEVTSPAFLQPGFSPVPLSATVRIMDSSGTELVKTLTDTVGFSNGRYIAQFQWDGTDNDGNLLPAGDYAPSFAAAAPDGQKVTASSCTGITSGGKTPTLGPNKPTGGDKPDDKKPTKPTKPDDPDGPPVTYYDRCGKPVGSSAAPPKAPATTTTTSSQPYAGLLGLTGAVEAPDAGSPSSNLPDFLRMDLMLPDDGVDPFNPSSPGVRNRV